jgi:hypothetical protein
MIPCAYPPDQRETFAVFFFFFCFSEFILIVRLRHVLWYFGVCTNAITFILVLTPASLF